MKKIITAFFVFLIAGRVFADIDNQKIFAVSSVDNIKDCITADDVVFDAISKSRFNSVLIDVSLNDCLTPSNDIDITSFQNNKYLQLDKIKILALNLFIDNLKSSENIDYNKNKQLCLDFIKHIAKKASDMGVKYYIIKYPVKLILSSTHFEADIQKEAYKIIKGISSDNVVILDSVNLNEIKLLYSMGLSDSFDILSINHQGADAALAVTRAKRVMASQNDKNKQVLLYRYDIRTPINDDISDNIKRGLESYNDIQIERDVYDPSWCKGIIYYPIQTCKDSIGMIDASNNKSFILTDFPPNPENIIVNSRILSDTMFFNHIVNLPYTLNIEFINNNDNPINIQDIDIKLMEP
ncbi:MAG: hypothetical protein SNJ70_01020, partial [Armatimonadota bacterium]